MTTLSVIKDITITSNKRGNDYANLQIRHKNNLILDNVTLLFYTNSDLVLGIYTKPYCEKYLGLVVEWIVNNLKSNNVYFELRTPGTGSTGAR